MFIWLYVYVLIILGHHAASFGDTRHCVRGDKVFLICHVISKDYGFKELSEFIGGSPL